MRTHIIIALFALVLSACASKQNVTFQGENPANAADQYTFRDAGSRIR